jgi:hypothetical protein
MRAGVRVIDVLETLMRSRPVRVGEELTWTIALEALRLAV